MDNQETKWLDDILGATNAPKEIEADEHAVYTAGLTHPNDVELERILEEMLSALNDRQRQVLRLHFGLEDGYCHSLDEIGKLLSVSKERVRQITGEAVKKLQKLSAGLGLEDFLES